MVAGRFFKKEKKRRRLKRRNRAFNNIGTVVRALILVDQKLGSIEMETTITQNERRWCLRTKSNVTNCWIMSIIFRYYSHDILYAYGNCIAQEDDMNKIMSIYYPACVGRRS